MLSPADFVNLPYTSDLTEGGIQYALRSLPYTYDRMGGAPTTRMRRIVAGIAVELAFRRYLGAKNIRFDTLGATPFTEPDRYDISLGGRRVDIKSTLITSRKKIRRIQRSPEVLLQAEALVPSDQLDTERFRPRDIYLFAFLLGLVATHRESVQQALQAGQPVYLLHAFPTHWARPAHWGSLGKMHLKSEPPQEARLTLGGQDAHRDFCTCEIVLSPGVRSPCPQDFHTLIFLRTHHMPTHRIGIHSPVLDELCVIPPLISPQGWDNLWVYGMRILLVGYITKAEFRQKAQRLPAGSPTFQYPRTRTENFALPVAHLHPIATLLQAARKWQQ
ncbi:MAG: hypothetical protein D6755_08605 [Anaerolineae bacterium]|nr:MAG: hypothetical protein D6755_08605 [Anaerolineae bacterium]